MAPRHFQEFCVHVHLCTSSQGDHCPSDHVIQVCVVWPSLESIFSYVQSFCTSTVRWELVFFSCLPPFPRTDRHYIKDRHCIKDRHYIIFKRTKNLNFVFAGRMWKETWHGMITTWYRSRHLYSERLWPCKDKDIYILIDYNLVKIKIFIFWAIMTLSRFETYILSTRPDVPELISMRRNEW